MHTQAHPDDEQADLLTWLSRGRGVRTSLLSLTRGESGGNILGVEFFDELALLRTEEFLLAANYYGLDDLYFTNLVDYGFSKRVEEAYEKWGREKVLEEMVRVIRVNRPVVIISRFHGTNRDGHGNHQAAGEISPEAFLMAADPKAFPEQLNNEGLRPWKALKFYRGGIKPDEHFNVDLNTGEHSSWLGESYKNFSLLGYSFHRSQFGGQRNQVNGPFHQYYERLHSHVKTEEKETDFFDGIDISICGIFKVTGENAPVGIMPLLDLIQKEVDTAIAGFKPSNPTSIIPFLTKGLTTTRSALSLLNNQPDAYFILKIKEHQFMDAINTVLGITLEASAVPQRTKETTSFYAPPPTMGFVVPGQSFRVDLSFLNGSVVPVIPFDIKIITEQNFKVSNTASKKLFLNNGKLDQTFMVTVPAEANFSQPYYHRNSLLENKYKYDDDGNVNLPNNQPAMMASATYFVDSVLVEIQKPVEVTQSNLPYGYNRYTLKLAPAVAVNLSPKTGIMPMNAQAKEFNIYVELINNKEDGCSGKLELKLPSNWKASSLTKPFAFTSGSNGRWKNLFRRIQTNQPS
jgi:LmbE family N-acetylglucosaminyl deacetylase